MNTFETTTKGRALFLFIVLNGLFLFPLKSQTYDTGDVNILLAIDAACDVTNSLNWNTEPDPSLWTGVSWNTVGTRRVYGLDITEKSLSGELNASGLVKLVDLFCYGNQLTGLNISGDTLLDILSCMENQLTSLNISGLTSLRVLGCRSNDLTSLDVSEQTNMEFLDCQDNQLADLNVSGLEHLTTLSCQNNNLTALNLSGLSSLNYLDCSLNNLTGLDLSDLTNLTTLDCKWNSLTALDVSALLNLTFLNCWINNLTVLDVSALTNLNYLGCGDNQLTSIDVSALSGLNTLLCSNNPLTSLDATACTNLSILGCQNNQLSILNTAGLTNITELYCSDNSLSSLDVSLMTKLSYLDCHENILDSLDVSADTSLETLICYENKLPFSSLATGLNVPDFNYNPQNTLYGWSVFYGDDTIDYSREAVINDSITTFTFAKNSQPYVTNQTGILFTSGEGQYNCIMINNNFPGLSLLTAPVTVTGLTGTNTLISNSETDFYPNPATNKIYFYNSETIKEVELLSINGQELKRWNNNFTEIQLSGYSKGVYLLRIKTGRGTDAHKLVIE